MSQLEQANLAHVRAYLAAVERHAPGEELASFYTPDALQIELPNRLNPGGGTSDVTTMLQRAEQGRHVLRAQRFEIKSQIAQGSWVAMEATWTGTLAIPLGTLQPGATMRAHFAMFFEFDGGLIKLQRNYDCFEPW